MVMGFIDIRMVQFMKEISGRIKKIHGNFQLKKIFSEGEFHGSGKITYPNKESFEGEFRVKKKNKKFFFFYFLRVENIFLENTNLPMEIFMKVLFLKISLKGLECFII